jgi:tRNA G18 (ribose-2'-O)-methylase SpoU
MKLITDSITIPSHNSNGSESLNAAMAAGIIVSEFFRQLY